MTKQEKVLNVES